MAKLAIHLPLLPQWILQTPSAGNRFIHLFPLPTTIFVVILSVTNNCIDLSLLEIKLTKNMAISYPSLLYP